MNDELKVVSDEKVGVRYVGVKEVKYDNICHTRTLWRGAGDVQQVPIAVAAKLAQFPKVWEVVMAGSPGSVEDTVESLPAGGGPLAAGGRPVGVLKLNKKG